MKTNKLYTHTHTHIQCKNVVLYSCVGLRKWRYKVSEVISLVELITGGGKGKSEKFELHQAPLQSWGSNLKVIAKGGID